MANEKRLIEETTITEKQFFVETEYGSGWVVAIEDIADAPTVDAVEVVHGRWVSSGGGFDCCSECRKVYTDGYFTAMGIKPRAQFNYCPNCGAKMDGDGNG